MAAETIVLYRDAQLELKTTRKTVEQYIREGLLIRALLPGFQRARGITRKSLDALLEKIGAQASGEGVRQ